jgi:hypothetical protein
MTTIKDINKKLTCLIDNNYIEHVNLKNLIEELKNKIIILSKQENLLLNTKNNINQQKKEKDEEFIISRNLVFEDFKKNFNSDFNDLLPVYIKTEQNLKNFIQENTSKTTETIICNIKTEQDLNNFVKNIIERDNNCNKQNLDHIILEINEEYKNLKKEIQKKVEIIKEDNNKIEEKISKNLNEKIKDSDDKILIVRNDTHKNFTNIDKALINLKGDLLSKINSIQKNQETLKNFFCEKVNEIENKSKGVQIKSINDEQKKEQDLILLEITNIKKALSLLDNTDLIIDIVNTKTNKIIKDGYTVIEEYNLINEKFEKFKEKIENIVKEKNNENSIDKEIINKVDIIISSKFVEMNKNITEFIVKNASDLVFSNKSFCTKIEKWIQSQILQALKK